MQEAYIISVFFFVSACLLGLLEDALFEKIGGYAHFVAFGTFAVLIFVVCLGLPGENGIHWIK